MVFAAKCQTESADPARPIHFLRLAHGAFFPGIGPRYLLDVPILLHSKACNVDLYLVTMHVGIACIDLGDLRFDLLDQCFAFLARHEHERSEPSPGKVGPRRLKQLNQQTDVIALTECL